MENTVIKNKIQDIKDAALPFSYLDPDNFLDQGQLLALRDLLEWMNTKDLNGAIKN